MSTRGDAARAEFILKMLSNIEEIVARHGSPESALDDEVEGRPAILMALHQVGETLSKIDPELIDRFDLSTEAKGSSGLRNFIAHDYMGVDLKIVESVIKEFIPELKRKVRELHTSVENHL